MKSIYDEALKSLINISVTFDEVGMSPTIIGCEEYEGHFKDVFKIDYEQIHFAIKEAKRIESLLNLYKSLATVRFALMDKGQDLHFRITEQIEERIILDSISDLEK